MALRCLVQSQSAKTLSSVLSVTPYNRRRVSGQLLEKFKEVYGSPEGVSVDNLLEVM